MLAAARAATTVGLIMRLLKSLLLASAAGLLAVSAAAAADLPTKKAAPAAEKPNCLAFDEPTRFDGGSWGQAEFRGQRSGRSRAFCSVVELAICPAGWRAPFPASGMGVRGAQIDCRAGRLCNLRGSGPACPAHPHGAAAKDCRGWRRRLDVGARPCATPVRFTTPSGRTRAPNSAPGEREDGAAALSSPAAIGCCRLATPHLQVRLWRGRGASVNVSVT